MDTVGVRPIATSAMTLRPSLTVRRPWKPGLADPPEIASSIVLSLPSLVWMAAVIRTVDGVMATFAPWEQPDTSSRIASPAMDPSTT